MTSTKFLLATAVAAIALIGASPASGAQRLGGLNLYSYCRSIGYQGVILTSPVLSPDAVFNWRCAQFSWDYSSYTLYPFDMDDACAWQYGHPSQGTFAEFLDRNNAYTWVCYLGHRDVGAPVLNLPGDIIVNATGPAGALVTYTASATDDVDPNPAVGCSPASGSVFAIGSTTVSCTATDSSGKSTTGTFSVIVKGAGEQLADEETLVQSFGLSHGQENSFLVKLDHALAAVQAGDIANACSQLDAFANEARAQSGKALTEAQAAQLIADAQRIEAVLGC